MKVLVNGVGNIGTTLLNILIDYKDILGIREVYALKNSIISDWNRPEIELLQKKGILVCSTEANKEFPNFKKILEGINYIFDTTANTFGLKNKEWYEKLPNLKACSAQGSEKKFGLSFMADINNESAQNQKFIHIVSCNTHAIGSLINTFGKNNLTNICEADFVIVRRSEDIGNHERLVSANVISRHRDMNYGTHHAVDAIDLFRTIYDQLPKITSSDITTPSQLMHTVRFNIRLKNKTSQEEINHLITASKYISCTSKFDSNVIFELGRRYSPYGRIYSHAIINNNNIIFDQETNKIKGWAFIPQEGNTIISTIAAFLLQTGNKNTEEIIDKISKDLINKEW